MINYSTKIFDSVVRSISILFIIALMPVSLYAAEYYVDINNPNASDQNNGSESMPWRTLQKAAQADLLPGDTVFVKPGTYNITSGGTWSRAAITPKNSGEPGNPITFKSLPKHGAILDGGVSAGQGSFDGTQALIGSSTSHVVIDGFIVRNTFSKGILVMGPSQGVVIQNNIVSNVSHTHSTDNTDGIRVENTSSAVVRNNLIFNVRNGSNTHNAAGIKLYHSTNGIFENNEVYYSGSGIFDKNGGRNNIIRRNYVHDVNDGIFYAAADNAVAGGNEIYENIVANTRNAIQLYSIGIEFDDSIHLYNNVLAEYSDIGLRVPEQSDNRLNSYNNIFYRTGSVGTGDIVTYDDPPRTIENSDYNIFVTQASIQIGRYLTNRYVSLSEWNSITTWDGHSAVANVEFVDPANDDFRLAPGSFASGFGRIGGLPSGAAVDAGAFRTPNIEIGLIGDLTQPKSPLLENVVIEVSGI